MSPEHLKAISLYSALDGLFQSARCTRNYSLNALPEQEVANLLVEELAPVLVRAEAIIEQLAARRTKASASDVLAILQGA